MALSAIDQYHLNAAEGWLDLDEPVEAAKELEEISFASRVDVDVLLLRCRLYLAVHKAEYTFDIATTLTTQLPEIAEAWFYLACASSRLGHNDVAATALKKCFLAADRDDRAPEWQQRALDARDLEGYWCSEQMGI